MNMARSTGLGKTNTKVRNLKRLVLFSGLLLLSLASCTSNKPVVKQSYYDLYLRDTIPYTLASHEEVSKNLLIFLPPALDTVVFEKTHLYKEIFDAGYDILCIYQPPAEGEYFYNRKSMDFKGQHIQNTQNLIKMLSNNKQIAKSRHTILMGIEQGAYMTPLLMANTGIDTAIYINASPFSMYLSMQRIASGKVEWNAKRQDYINAKFGIDSLHVFKQKVEEVESLSSDLYSLGKFTNMYWLSYHANYMLDEYRLTPGHSFWINFEDYPFFKQSDWEYLQLLDNTRHQGSGEYHLLKNFQSFSEENWEQLEQVILPFLVKAKG